MKPGKDALQTWKSGKKLLYDIKHEKVKKLKKQEKTK